MTTVLTEPGMADTDGAATADADLDGDRVLVAAADLPAVIGWSLRAEGLCRGDVCVPVRDRADIEHGDSVDLRAVAEILGSPVLVAPDEEVVAIGVAPTRRADALRGGVAPDFSLPDLDGRPMQLSQFAGKRRLLVAFATW